MEALGTLGLNGMAFISQVVNFLLIMLLLTSLLYKPVQKALIERQERIAQGLRDAERAREMADEAEQEKENILFAARDESQQLRAQAVREAETAGQEIRARAEAEASTIRQRAQQEAEEQKAAILIEAQKDIATLAMLGAERILGRELQNQDEQEQLIASLLADQKRSG